MNIKELLESRGHKILATKMRNMAAANNQSKPDTQTTHTQVAAAADLTKNVKPDDNPPFEPDAPKRNPSAKAGKYGVGHSIARHLARQGMKTLTKEEVEALDEGGLAGAYHKGYFAHSKEGKLLRDNPHALHKDPLSHKSWVRGFNDSVKANPRNDVKEDVEQIDELSKDTLKSYIGKATKDMGERKRQQQIAVDRSNQPRLAGKYGQRSALATADMHADKATSRAKNIGKAAMKFAEEVEQIDAYLTESEKKLAKLAADIEKREGLLSLAAEKRKMRKGSARHYQSPAEINHAAKISDLRQQHYDLKKSMTKVSEETEVDEQTTGSDLTVNRNIHYNTQGRIRHRKGTLRAAVAENAGLTFHEFRAQMAEQAVAPVEHEYYKGRKLHFARGNRGGKSSSNEGGAAGSGPNGDGGSGDGGV
jgi:hypothetical protein